MGKKKDTADAIELEEEEEEDVEIEEEEVDEEAVEQVKGEEDEDEETEAEETEEEDEEKKDEDKKAPGVAVRDSILAEGVSAKIFYIFMQNVWPILKKNGWEKVRTSMAMLLVS
jgi:TATA-binding protein-associated factor Taf7